jgi:hypothetical protein
MKKRTLQIIQQNNTFTMNLLEDGEFKGTLESGNQLTFQWWLNPRVFNLEERLRDNGCSDAQIRQAYDSLLSGHETNLELDLPQ